MAIGALGISLMVGCQQSASPTPRVAPVAQYDSGYPTSERIKPLPDPSRGEMPPPPFDDGPLVYQRPPEQKAFLEGYNAVQRPRIAIFVNRTLQGDLVPVNEREPSLTVERRQSGTGTIERRDVNANPFRNDRSDPVEVRGPGEYRETSELYLRPGQYDEIYAKQVDYAAIETVLTQWLACDGQTTIVSPATVRERLTEDEIRKMQDGRPRLLNDVAKSLNCDILIQVQAKPTRQTDRGLEVRLIAEAVNIVGGESIARATVLIPPPLDSEKINRFTRFIGRKLMADMTMTWSSPGPAGQRTPVAPPLAPPGAERPPAAETSPPRLEPPAQGSAAPTVPPTLAPAATSPTVPTTRPELDPRVPPPRGGADLYGPPAQGGAQLPGSGKEAEPASSGRPLPSTPPSARATEPEDAVEVPAVVPAPAPTAERAPEPQPAPPAEPPPPNTESPSPAPTPIPQEKPSILDRQPEPPATRPADGR